MDENEKTEKPKKTYTYKTIRQALEVLERQTFPPIIYLVIPFPEEMEPSYDEDLPTTSRGKYILGSFIHEPAIFVEDDILGRVGDLI